MPVLVLQKTNVSYLEEKNIEINLINAFGSELSNYKTVLNYSVSELEETENLKDIQDSTDLEDEPEEVVESNSSTSFENTSKFSIDISNYIKKPSLYVLKVNAVFEGEKTFNFNYNFNIKAFSKIKINNLKLSVSNTNQKNDENETTIEFPKRSFKTIKATQKSIIRLKINVNFIFK